MPAYHKRQQRVRALVLSLFGTVMVVNGAMNLSTPYVPARLNGFALPSEFSKCPKQAKAFEAAVDVHVGRSSASITDVIQELAYAVGECAEYPETIFLAADLSSQIRVYDFAETMYKKGTQVEREAVAYQSTYALCGLLLKQRRFAEALVFADALVARWPEVPEVHIKRSLIQGLLRLDREVWNLDPELQATRQLAELQSVRERHERELADVLESHKGGRLHGGVSTGTYTPPQPLSNPRAVPERPDFSAPREAGCTKYFIDLGANVGDAVGKFLKPEEWRDVGASHFQMSSLAEWTEQMQNSTELSFVPADYCIILLEANPIFAELLETEKRKFSGDTDRIFTYPGVASASSEGDLSFHLDLRNFAPGINFGSSSFDGQSSREVLYSAVNVTVPAVNISRLLLDDLRIQRGDSVIIKMDIEGAEYNMIRSMLNTGAACLVDHLLLEWHPKARASSVPPIPENTEEVLEWALQGECQVQVHLDATD